MAIRVTRPLMATARAIAAGYGSARRPAADMRQQNSFPPAQGQKGYGSDPYYRGMPHDEDMYEDQPRARRRGGLMTVMAVLALAVVGTAGAFGYRALFSAPVPC